MTRGDPNTVRVTCPQCDAKTAFATIPDLCAIASEERADGTVRSECRDCGTEFFVHFARVDD